MAHTRFALTVILPRRVKNFFSEIPFILFLQNDCCFRSICLWFSLCEMTFYVFVCLEDKKNCNFSLRYTPTYKYINPLFFAFIFLIVEWICFFIVSICISHCRWTKEYNLFIQLFFLCFLGFSIPLKIYERK